MVVIIIICITRTQSIFKYCSISDRVLVQLDKIYKVPLTYSDETSIFSSSSSNNKRNSLC